MNMKIVHHHFVCVPTPMLGWDTYKAVELTVVMCVHFDKYNRINNNPFPYV